MMTLKCNTNKLHNSRCKLKSVLQSVGIKYLVELFHKMLPGLSQSIKLTVK